MKKSRNRISAIVLALIVLYIVLLVLLLIVEGESSGFGGVSDAIWYLLATLTTVGYGDIAPVTPLGRFIGAILMLMSAGVMAWLIGLVIALFYGRLYPEFWLWKNRNRDWYIFNKFDSSTGKLASSLAIDDENAAWIFLGKDNTLAIDFGDHLKHVLIIDSSLEILVNKKRNNSNCTIFILGENSWENINTGKVILASVDNSYPVKVICESESVLADIPENIKLINRYDLTARSFWQNYPLDKDEKKILFIGDGKLAGVMLERALMNNVFSKNQSVKYYVFGKWGDFLLNHKRLNDMLDINNSSYDRDSVYYTESSWNSDEMILTEADRIIICGDSNNSNASLSVELINYFPTNAKIFVCSETAPADVTCFGTDDELMSRKLIMGDFLDQIAIRLNDMYREKTGSGSKWEELSPWHKASNIASADHLRVKIGILLPDADTRYITKNLCREAMSKYEGLSEEEKDECRWIEHERWCRFHYLHNWKFNEKRDNKLRRHPLLKPYEELTDNEKRLDDSSWEIIGDLAESLGEEIL
jgi:hypothetical protein